MTIGMATRKLGAVAPLLALLLLAICPAAQAEPAIVWRVENPFRFFTDPAHTEMHRATFNALTPCLVYFGLGELMLAPFICWAFSGQVTARIKTVNRMIARPNICGP